MINHKLSIIIPVYNCSKYLAKCIDSVIEQEYENFELILIDDGSTDDSYEICCCYKEKDNRINVIHQDNGGVSSARNKGIIAAKGEYIMFLDSDDELEKNTFKITNQIIENHNSDIIRFNYKRVYNHLTKIYKYKTGLNILYSKEEYDKDLYPQIYNSSDLSFCVATFYNKKLVKKNLFDTNLKYGEDRKYFLECLINSDNIYFSDFCCYDYNDNDSSATNKKNEKALYLKLQDNLNVEKFIFEKIFNEESGFLKNIYLHLDDYIINTQDFKDFGVYLKNIKNIFSKNEMKKYNDYIKNELNVDLFDSYNKVEKYKVLKKSKRKIRLKQIIKKII